MCNNFRVDVVCKNKVTGFILSTFKLSSVILLVIVAKIKKECKIFIREDFLSAHLSKASYLCSRGGTSM